MVSAGLTVFARKCYSLSPARLPVPARAEMEDRAFLPQRRKPEHP
jgi:hypothetical protein